MLVADAAGNLWFAINAGIGEFNTTTHAISSFTFPSNGTAVSDTLGADGNIYFNEAVPVPPAIGRPPLFVNGPTPPSVRAGGLESRVSLGEEARVGRTARL